MKRICILLLAAIFALSLTACSSAEIENPAGLAEALYTAEIYSTDLYPLDANMIDSVFGLTASYTAAYGYATAGDAADEIAVIIAADNAGAETILAQLETHMTAFSKLYASYAPDQCPRIEGALLTRVGNVVIWCISDDTDAAKNIVENYTK